MDKKFVKNPIIRLTKQGNPGNIMMIYLAAIKMQEALGGGTICNVKIPIFDIDIPDLYESGQHAVHDKEDTNSKLSGRLPTRAYASALEKVQAKVFMLEGFYQNIDNFPSRSSFDYDKYFPLIENSSEGGSDEELVISIRGGDILKLIHPHYAMLPPEFYAFLIQKTRKRPVFYGQLDESPYMAELRERFPTAKFIPSRGVAEDFDYLRKSTHIVPSLSTFSWLAAWMSKAKNIYLPVAGIFSPTQHPSSMLLPIDDERYEFYSFPIYYALDIEHYRTYLDPVRNCWERTEPRLLSPTLRNRHESFDASLGLFDPDDYLRMNPRLADDHAKFGGVGLLNHFTTHGYWSGSRSFKFSDRDYAMRYPKASLEVALGKYSSLLDHYLHVGRHMGYDCR